MQASRINDKLDASIDKEILREELSKIEGLTGIPEADAEFPWDVTSSENYQFRINANGTVEKIVPEGTISETESFIGYYADLTGDGTIDGVIYADLAKGDNVIKEWNYEPNGAYKIPNVDPNELKDYKLITSSFPDGITEDPFKTGKTTSEVIAPIDSNSTDLKDRFYVMAFSDISSSTYYWDKNYNSKYNPKNYGTEDGFGKGKSNTKKMVTYWENNPAVEKPVFGYVDTSYGKEYQQIGTEYIEDWDSRDVWANITDGYSKGWFVPSKQEWSAFANELGISKSSSNDKYYSKLGLRDEYWSSSQSPYYGHTYDYSYAWIANFSNGNMYDGTGYLNHSNVNSRNLSVRLSATF